MKPLDSSLIAELCSECPNVPTALVERHVQALGDEYFHSFSREEVCAHLKAIAGLSAENPAHVLVGHAEDDLITCTIVAKDYPMEFSLITGVLAATRFSILSGDIFTYSNSPAPRSPQRDEQKRRRRRSTRPVRYIVDFFKGALEGPHGLRQWESEVREELGLIIGMLDKGDKESFERARHRVNEAVVKRLSEVHGEAPPILYPVHMEIDNDSSPYTRLKIVSEDTPAFLYTLSNALSGFGLSIEHVRIRTISNRVEDEVYLLNAKGNKVRDPLALDKIRLSTLITKQFTYFLAKAPDPYGALSRFEHMVDEMVRKPPKGKWVEMLSDPKALDHLAVLLGASEYLWEDFVRQQYESIIPMLAPYVGQKQFSTPSGKLPQAIRVALAGASTFEEKRKRLNEFKDREVFLIDLDHILSPQFDFHHLAESLTWLAENIVRSAAEIVYDELARRYGRPRTVAGLEARYTIMGLGKIGGAALGYASDIELLFIYGDSGKTDGPEIIPNAEFFERFVREVNLFIRAKRDGIFQIDLRLRPHGNDGPLACSLEKFWQYYGPGGQAHSYERLALVRLRAIGGDEELGRRVERMRDKLLYTAKCIDFNEIYKLRLKQIREKGAEQRLNAKFSPGGLVDIEYSIQMLQVLHGGQVAKLRTPKVHEALHGLAEAGVMGGQEALGLIKAYDFLRDLINALRMLRGSAKDLYLPEENSHEFEHLARRMGYKRGRALSPSEQLKIDFESHTATVRAFLEKHFGLDLSETKTPRTVADLVLLDAPPIETRTDILRAEGFRDLQRAYLNLRSLAGHGHRRQVFARLAVLAMDILSGTPDPDMALNNWERFVRTLGSAEGHFRGLFSQPQKLEILLNIFSSSQFLSDVLVRNPGFLDWVMLPEILNAERKREDLEGELRLAASTSTSRAEWLNKVRRTRRREILRIGVRDICLGTPVFVITRELSVVAEAFVQVVLEEALKRIKEERGLEQDWAELQTQFCIMAMGKLGGRELNYSSDIDLVGICADINDPFRTVYNAVMERVSADLSVHTEEGYAYRVDLRLRPFGSSGELVSGISALVDYYKKKASLWEVQAALKMRPIAGSIALGEKLMDRLQPILISKRKVDEVLGSVEKMRRGAVAPVRTRALCNTRDVKTGFGGIRDVEFFVQGKQLLHGHSKPEILKGNTLEAIDALASESVISADVADLLKQDYILLRRVEHFLQIYEDRQVHALPADEQELRSLAKRVLGKKAEAWHLARKLDQAKERIMKLFETGLQGGPAPC